ncbi:LysE family translocator [uncultured Litoreibacter sp.]|uniref:LysE family translocator n=1 Tax=uncultured Litoreibacter sp. TaxID=1392394 RepID=UPI002621AF4E|nr:LysE family translocator [uncultured Litoreibacter sp.]
MSFDLWLAFAAASTALLMIPGPTVLLVLSYALTQGKRVAVASALGVATGDLVAMTLSIIGLGAIIATSATAFTIVKYAGALYLLYLGIKMLRSERSDGLGDLSNSDHAEAWTVFRHTATVTALNPKSNTFFIAFVPQFIATEAAFAPQAGILIATFVVIAGVNALMFALAANAMRVRISRPSVLQWMTRAGGATLIAMAAFTATLRRAN